MKKVRWGILSTAKIGLEKVIPAMQKGSSCDIIAISSRDLERAKSAAEDLGIEKAYGSYEELLADSDVEAVYNPLPNHMHVSWSIKALEAGKHVLCEKPIGLSSAEGEELLDASSKYPHLKVMEAFMYRFHPQWERARDLVNDGQIGELRTIHSFFSYCNLDPKNIRNMAEIGGGGLMDIGCYCISLSRFIFGSEPQRVCGIVEYDPDFKTDRLASGMLDFGRGTATFTCATQLVPRQRVNIFGTEGRVEIEVPFNAPPDRPCKMWHQRDAEIEEIVFDICDQYTIQGDRFSQAVLENTDVSIPLEDAVANMKVVITDGIERIRDDRQEEPSSDDYRLMLARQDYWPPVKRLKGIYPLPSRRVATRDEYPDFFFHPQIYRADGEHVSLPPGTFDVTFTRGPEYIPQTKQLVVPTNVDSLEVTFQLKRWIDMAELGYYSADHHVHAAGCSHYESPEEGVRPEHMWRQVLGEDLNIASVLAWGPCWYHQKTFFTGKVHPLSTNQNLLRYDVEVSGFPSSHAGHVVLLRLKEDDYPGTTLIEEWPSWTLPVLQWAKAQGGVVGYAHSGWGLEPTEPTDELPNYVTPKMDGIGANEYIVTVTQDAVDFYSAGDTPAPWELNTWYHTLNSGFRTRLSGETDFPCIFDERVGLARSYVRMEGGLDYDGYVEAIREGRGYVSDGKSHFIDFSINGLELGMHDSELSLTGSQTANITARVAAYLSPEQDEFGAIIASRELNEQPYWNIERARIGTTRKVPVTLVVNGEPVATREIVADGDWKELKFTHPLDRSSWVALRVYPSSHTNPIFVIVDGKPIRLMRSIEWCRRAVDQCWKMKSPNIREEERPAAAAAYSSARQVYDQLIGEREASNI